MPNERPLLLLQPLATGQGRAGVVRGAVLGYRIAAVGGGPESTRARSSREEAAAEEARWRSRAHLRALIRLEHNYSCPL